MADNPDASTMGPVTRAVSAGGYTVNATATVSKIVWDMGDGDQVGPCGGRGARRDRHRRVHPRPDVDEAAYVKAAASVAVAAAAPTGGAPTVVPAPVQVGHVPVPTPPLVAAGLPTAHEQILAAAQQIVTLATAEPGSTG